jgi:hypothetical protein
MSVNSIGLPPATLSSVLSSLNSGGQAGDASGGNLSLSQLQRVLRQQLDQAFKQGSSLPETGTALADQVSQTLQQYGVSDEQRQTVVDQLNQIFGQAGSRSEARQNAQQLLDNFVQSLNGGAQQPSAASAGAGENFDATA